MDSKNTAQVARLNTGRLLFFGRKDGSPAPVSVSLDLIKRSLVAYGNRVEREVAEGRVTTIRPHYWSRNGNVQRSIIHLARSIGADLDVVRKAVIEASLSRELNLEWHYVASQNDAGPSRQWLFVSLPEVEVQTVAVRRALRA